jgi:two-component system response regulator RegA
VSVARPALTALLIDDDDVFRTTLQNSLRRRGVAARTAATVEEGLFALEDHPVELVIVDHRMPRGDGLSALSRFRRLAPEAVVIMLTGFGDIPLAVESVKEGADTLLTKPVDPDQLLKIAADLRAERRTAAAPRPSRTSGSFNLEEMEREAIKAALRECSGNIMRAAALLGIDRRTLQRKLKKIF